MNPENIFLTADWLNLIQITYLVPKDTLLDELPRGVELDLIEDKAVVSLVAFEFKNTKVKGVAVPFHGSFPEVNFRFYVKEGTNKGIVFLKEFVPKSFVTLFANMLYNEKYETIEMECQTDKKENKIITTHTFTYENEKYVINLEADNTPYLPAKDSVEHFVKQREWGYVKRNEETLKYRVEHALWKVYPIINFSHNIDFGRIYGYKWSFLNDCEPYNLLLAEGSLAEVYEYSKL